MSTKPIKLYSHAGVSRINTHSTAKVVMLVSPSNNIANQGPNPWKVAIILNELNVPYETEIMDFADLKKGPSVHPTCSPFQRTATLLCYHNIKKQAN